MKYWVHTDKVKRFGIRSNMFMDKNNVIRNISTLMCFTWFKLRKISLNTYFSSRNWQLVKLSFQHLSTIKRSDALKKMTGY